MLPSNFESNGKGALAAVAKNKPVRDVLSMTVSCPDVVVVVVEVDDNDLVKASMTLCACSFID